MPAEKHNRTGSSRSSPHRTCNQASQKKTTTTHRPYYSCRSPEYPLTRLQGGSLRVPSPTLAKSRDDSWYDFTEPTPQEAQHGNSTNPVDKCGQPIFYFLVTPHNTRAQNCSQTTSCYARRAHRNQQHEITHIPTKSLPCDASTEKGAMMIKIANTTFTNAAVMIAPVRVGTPASNIRASIAFWRLIRKRCSPYEATRTISLLFFNHIFPCKRLPIFQFFYDLLWQWEARLL